MKKKVEKLIFHILRRVKIMYIIKLNLTGLFGLENSTNVMII